MTPMEGRGLLRGGALLLGLSLVRVVLTGTGQDPLASGPAEDRLPELLEEAGTLGEDGKKASTPLADGETLDPNRAGAADLNRLPGVGPSVAGAVIRYRQQEGAFRSPEDLLAVSGIGPATLERIRPFLDFSRGAPLELRRARSTTTAVDLNRADRQELESLPGIGPALAGRILESRSRDGPFRNVEELARVAGIGPSTLERLRGLVRVTR